MGTDRREYNNQWYAKNKEKLREQQKAYREKRKEYMINYQKEYYEKNKEKLNLQNKSNYENNKEYRKEKAAEHWKKVKHTKPALKSQYGITIDDYNRMFEEQEGCCYICGVHQNNLDNSLNVDHNHATGRVRKLLCRKCNLAIGIIKENTNTINNLIKYLSNG